MTSDVVCVKKRDRQGDLVNQEYVVLQVPGTERAGPEVNNSDA